MLPLLPSLLKSGLNSGLKGRSFLTKRLASAIPSLQTVPIPISDWGCVHIDLREGSGHFWLQGAPWRECPREAGEQAVLRRFLRMGDVVYDIGANIGLYALLCAKLVGPGGQVVAFEPNPELLPGLRRTVAQLPNARLFPTALAEQSGKGTLYVPVGDQSCSSLANWTAGRGAEYEAHQVECEIHSLDSLVATAGLPLPRFVKCDVEGAERMVFAGGKQTLDRPDAPMLLFEANVHNAKGFNLPITAARDLLASYQQANFSFFEVQENEQGTLRPLVEMHPVHANILAVPARRQAELSQ